MQREAVAEILSVLPERAFDFTGSQYPAPVRATFLGDEELDMAALRRELLAKQDGDVRELLRPLLLAAEVVEAGEPDKERYFLSDGVVQSLVFMGSKWRAGWALVLGGDQGELVRKLRERSFLVFTDQDGLAETTYIGPRQTSPIYFLQLMVRYGLIWGGIAPGDDHEMSHFLEKDMPGLIIIVGELPPLKYLLALGLMKLGAPAVVPSGFPFPYGYRVVADSVADIIERGSQLPNLRQRYFEDEVISLPPPCDPALANERFQPEWRLGGGQHSFFCLRPAAQVGERLRVVGQPEEEAGILVEIAAEHFSDDIALSVEKAALKAVNYLPGLRAYEDAGRFHLDLAAGAVLDDVQVGEAIYWGIRLLYPRLRDIAIVIVYDPEMLATMSAEVCAYKEERRRLVAGMTEDNTEEFCACTECRPFSLVHTCILTPDRTPMCAARSYASVKAAAYFGSANVPWRRRGEKELPMRLVFSKGRLLDSERGEWEGCDRAYRELTGGKLARVHLHSLRDHPLTSCGCFQALAFWLPEVQGLGIMQRGSKAVTPDGQTWEALANRAGGKQSPGIVGVSLQYIRSPRFLRGDGGIANIVWVDSELYKKLAGAFPPGQRVATEKDVTSTDELREFVGRIG